MIDLSTNIIVYHKSDIDFVIDSLKKNEITKPIYVLEYEKNYNIQFDSEYEFDIQDDLLQAFPEYEFTSDVNDGRKEIRVTITTVQHSTSSDNWGRGFNSDPIEKTVYLLKRNKTESTNEPNMTFRVIFGDVEKEYKVNVVDGMDSNTKEKGFIILGPAKENGEQPDIIVNELFPNKGSAFRRGFFMMTKSIDKEFDEFLASRKRTRKKRNTKG